MAHTDMTMNLIDELIGYASANAKAAKTETDRETWAAHHRNCVKVKAEIDRLLRCIASIEDELTRDPPRVGDALFVCEAARADAKAVIGRT